VEATAVKAVKLSQGQWRKVLEHLHEEYPKTVFMIRSKMKAVLGFTIREHNHWENGEHEFQIHLDFYSENKRTMFLLKFSHIIGSHYEER
jgi:hypothetical protein